MAELLGTFCYVFFYLSQTEEKTVISQIETIHCFVLAAAFIAARTIVAGNSKEWSGFGTIMNPAIAIGIFFASWFNDIGNAFKFVWLYPVFPLMGAVAAIFFFEFVYKKTQQMLSEHEGGEEGPPPTEFEKDMDAAIAKAAPDSD